MKITKIKQCRSCGSSELKDIISFGNVYVSDFLKPGQRGKKAPLDLVLCQNCWLLQLRHTVIRTDLYNKYWYVSGMNQSMIDALTDVTNQIKKLVPLKAGDTVIDIGSNDSSLLRTYKIEGLNLVGYEPAENLMELAYKDLPENTTIINDFYSANKYRAMAVSSIAMFYDLHDNNSFVKQVKDSLLPEGIWIIQMAYTPWMFDDKEYDTLMCHEHIEAYTLISLEYLLNKYDLEAFKVELNYVNAGSFRIYIQHKGGKQTIDPSVQAMRDKELREGYNTLKPYLKFAEQTKSQGKQLHDFVEKQVKQGKKVYGYGASTKGNYILQYSKLNSKLVTAIADRNPMKWGFYTVGTKIPVIPEEEARKQKPDYFIIFPYTFFNEFKEREKEFLARGGKFINPIDVKE